MMKYFEIIVNNPVALVFFGMIIGGFVLLVVSFLGKSSSDSIEHEMENKIKKEIVRDKDFEEVREQIFQLYKDIEIAKMKFRYVILDEKLDKNLYVKCEEKLKEMKKNHQKLVATDIVLEEFRILSRSVEKDMETIDVFLHVSQYDYVIDKEKKVVRGTDEGRYQIEYKITVTKNLESGQYKVQKRECVGKWIKKF